VVRREDEDAGKMRAAADYVARMRRRLQDGQEEIERQHGSVEETNQYLASMAEWIDATERELSKTRTHPAGGDDSA
jgi:hypothetical protein